MGDYPATIAGLTRHVQFRACVQKDAGPTDVEVELFDVSVGGGQVSLLSYSATNDLTEVSSGDLTVGSGATDIRSDIDAIYEASVRRVGGAPGDLVYLTNARVVIFYS